jgi:hypothetical protein
VIGKPMRHAQFVHIRWIKYYFLLK